MKTIKAISPFLIALACGISAQAGSVVNINATDLNGAQSLTLGPGTYSVSVVGTNVKGAIYNGWDVATANFGTASATPAPNEWTERFSISLGSTTTSYNLPGNPSFSSATAGLTAYQNSIIYVDGTNTPADSTLALDSAIFTLTSTQAVKFSLPDYLWVDNWGGESLSVSAVPSTSSATPEPSTFGVMGVALAGAAIFLRRKVSRQTASKA